MKTQDGTVTPELRFEITQENYERAITENSGSCIVADAIKEKYPPFSNIKVDVATVRFTDKERGVRYVYLTPPSIVDTLLFFDQGWKEEKLPKTLRLRTALQIIPIARSASMLRIQAEQRASRLAELEAKEQSGEALTSHEKSVLKRLQNPKKSVDRPTNYGSIRSEAVEGSEEVIIRGRTRSKENYKLKHPNMLAGRTRRFGAKTAKPGVVFQEAVEITAKAKAEAMAKAMAEAQVKEILARMEQGKKD